jgi:hypothetical protein
MANEQTIDQLNIEINAEAKQSSSGLDKIIASIEKLKTVTGGGIGELTGIAASLSKLQNTVLSLKGQSGTVTSLVNSISKLNDVKTDRISGNISTVSNSLKSLLDLSPELKSMISDLGSLARSGNGGVSGNALSLEAAAAKAQATIDKSALTSSKAQEGLKAIADKNAQIEESARAAAAQEQNLTDSINRAIAEHQAQFGSAGAFSNKTADLGAVVPDYVGKISSWPKNSPSEINSGSINELKASMGEIGNVATSATDEIASGSSRAAGFVDRLKESFNTVKSRLSEIDTSSQRTFSMGRLYGWYFILRQIASTFGGWINNINSYIENMNLFDVAMGSAAQSGEKLAYSLQSVLGIDSGEAMRYMGVFNELTSSFGVANKQAVTMSENLTQLGYDLASFYNISTETSFNKLESGLTGQSRALRQLGIDTSTARLQQELYNLGFKEKVKDLTEADKAELRYIAIMKQTTDAQGDMARTIQTPANALRVLEAQATIAGRAIGSIFIPALEAILPPTIAAIEVIGDLASELASLVGFKLPKIDYSSLKDITNSADDASQAVSGIGDDAQKSKKQLDNLISGFDELNILQTDNSDSTATSAGAGTNGNILSGIDLPSYNALSTAVSNNIDSLKKKIRDFIDAFRSDPLTAFSDALWGVNGAFGDLGKWLSYLDYADILNGITAAIIGFGLTKNPVLALAIGAVAVAISHFLPEKSKIDLLNASLISLGGALVLKMFTGMPFKLALGITTLAESGLIELIGKDNAINLLTSALTGMGAGMLAFSFTGNLPLSVGIGAVSAAISGLAIHFSDMQIAPALLAGVTSGLLAFKLGMDDWSAGAVGIGVAIASFAELNNIAPELRTGLLGIAGAVTAAGLAFQTGFGVEGIVISAVAGAFIALGVGLIQAEQDAEKADLSKRFGEISLSATEVEDIAKRLTTTPWTVKIDAAINAEDKVKEFEKNLTTDMETLNKMNWEVSVGIKLTKTDLSTYKEIISSFISDAKSYVQQQHYAVSLAIDAILEPGSATAKNLSDFTNKYYNATQIELDKLGTQLSEEVNKAFADNVLTEGEVIKIQDIQKKMNDLLQKIADQKYTATLKSLEMDTKSTEITSDSFKNLQDKIQTNIQDELKQAGQSKITVIEQIEAQYQYNKEHNISNADQIYKQSLQDAQDSFNSKKVTLELSGLNISLDTLNSKFNSELKNAEPVWASGVQAAMSNGWKVGIDNSKGVYTSSVSDLVNAVSGSYQVELGKLNSSGKISNAAQQNIKSLVSALQPTETDLKQIASAATAAGKSVPENVAKGIADIEQMKAISGNAEAINYMVGQKLSTDTTFLNTLATAKDAGKNIDSATAQGLTDNLQLVRDSATGAITGIKDSVTGKVTEITPTLKQNLQDLGVNMSNSLVTGAANNGANSIAGAKMLTDTGNGALSKQTDLKKTMGDIGTNTASALTTSANKKVTDDIPTWQGMMDAIIVAVKLRFGIHSPSTVFTDIGNNIIQGLWNGVQDTWNGFMKWWTNLHIPVPHLEFGWESLDNYDNVAAKAAKKLGLTQIPTMSIDWYANGGAFDSASIIGVGEYPDATTNPEVVAPQSIIKETVEESNEGMVTVLAQILEVAQQIAEKDNSTYLDGKKISDNTNKYNANRGYNLGCQST